MLHAKACGQDWCLWMIAILLRSVAAIGLANTVSEMDVVGNEAKGFVVLTYIAQSGDVIACYCFRVLVVLCTSKPWIQPLQGLYYSAPKICTPLMPALLG